MAILDRTRAGYLKLAASGIILGSIGLFVRALPLPVPVILFYRVFFAVVTIGAVTALAGSPHTLRLHDYRGLVFVSGLGLTVNWLLFFTAFKLTTIAVAILLTYTMPIMAAVLAHFFLHERLESRAVGALAVAVAGVVLIIGPSVGGFNGSQSAGAACALGGAAIFATLVVVSKRIMSKVEPPALMFWANLIAVVILFPFALLGPGPAGLKSWVLLVIMGTVHSGLGIFLYLSGLSDVKVQHASVLMYIEPLSAVIFAALLLGEVPTWFTLAGGVLILGAGYLVVRQPVESRLPPD